MGVEKRKGKRKQASLDPELHKALVARAQKEDRSASSLLAHAARIYLKMPVAASEPSAADIAGRWLRSLPKDATLALFRAAEAFRRSPECLNLMPEEPLRTALGISNSRGRPRKAKKNEPEKE